MLSGGSGLLIRQNARGSLHPLTSARGDVQALEA